jgi:Calcineurin-like phosphoesterase.
MQVKQNDLVSVVLALVVVGTASCRPSTYATPSPQEIESSLFLIGDAGEQDPRDVGVPLDSLTAQASVAPQRSIIVFLGDNVYESGVPERGTVQYPDARRRMEDQVRAVPAGVRAIFLPGNHDWGQEEADGLFAIRRQGELIDQLAQERDIEMLPRNGCPGPVSIDIGRLRLIALDTQWWLQDYIVHDSASHCAQVTTGDVTAALRRDVRAPGTHRVVVVAGHHPLMTGGVHGGYCGVTGPFRRFAGRTQDVLSSTNLRMRDSIESAFRGAVPLVYAAGHDHSLQVLRAGNSSPYVLVSGAGSPEKASCVVRLRESLYTSPHRSGFMRLDIMRGGGVLLRVFRFTSSGSGGVAYSHWLEPLP